MPLLLCCMSFMFRVANKPFMLSVEMLNVIMLSVVMLSVVAASKWADDTTLKYQNLDFKIFKLHIAANISERFI